MNKFRYFFDFPQKDILFRTMMNECPEVLLNIEILFENKLTLDKYYHEPKKFIVQCNNILSNIIVFIEFARKAKSKYLWLYNGISELLEKQSETYIILKALRNSAVHKELIIPDGAFSFGLYKLLTTVEYNLKLGLGNDQIKNNIGDRYLLNTVQLFQELLSFHFVFFIDINHSTFKECLGITRRWYYDISYEYNEIKFRKTINIYDIINSFFDQIVDATCIFFSDYSGIRYKKLSISNTAKYNFVNTLLEIDLYPNLFSKWWDREVVPLNLGALLEHRSKKDVDTRYEVYEEIYEDLPKSFEEYIGRIKKYKTIQFEDFVTQKDYNRYVYFISLHHWYFNRVFSIKFIRGKFDFTLITQLLKLSGEYIKKVELNFNAISQKEKNKCLQEIGIQLEKIRIEAERISNSNA